MAANSQSERSHMLDSQSPSNPEYIRRYFEDLTATLELIERSQHEAAKEAKSEAMARRHEELAKGVATAIQFISFLKVDYLRKIA